MKRIQNLEITKCTRSRAQWKPIPDYEETYEMSSWGGVSSEKKRVVDMVWVVRKKKY
jgi:hypothetical protein